MDIGYALGPTRAQNTSRGNARRGSFVQYLLFVGNVAATVSGRLPGPLMGMCSMLWLMMRNDSAVDPKLAWMLFGAWCFFASMYLILECRRVSNHRLYVLLSVAFSCVCMSIIAVLQRSSSQGGLVTAVPPCISFAAYSIAYFFPTKREVHINPV